MSDYDMASPDQIADETKVEPNIERDDTDGGPGAGVMPAANPDLPGEELVDLDDDDVDDETGTTGLEGNPLLQQNI